MEPIRRILIACILQACAIAVPMCFGGSQNADAAEVAPGTAAHGSSPDARLSAKTGESGQGRRGSWGGSEENA